MTAEPAATDTAAFLELAVREQLLTPDKAKQLTKKAARSKLTPGQLCVEAGQLSPIQAEAIEGVLSPNSVADGYEVVGLLGHGGIGIVYRARQPSLDRIVALKTISTSRLSATAGGSMSTAIARFQQEAVAIAKLKHPNIVTAYDYGATTDRVFLAMEMVDGVDLDSYIKRAGHLSETVAWQIARQVAAALAHALESGVVHRDIKPANLLVTDPPAGYPLPAGIPLVKVTDFGLARLNADSLSNEETRLTFAGSMMGTPHYMAPEQIEDPNVGFEADIYALGASVYHMITGKPPLAGMAVMKVFAAKLSDDEAALVELPEEFGQPSRELLSNMMARKPNQRQRNYNLLLSEIDRLLENDPREAAAALAPTISATQRLTSERVPEEATIDLSPTARTSHRKPLWLMALSGTVLLASIFVYWKLPGVTHTPPTPKYEVSESLNGIRILYDGRNAIPWQGVRAEPIESDHTGMLNILGVGSAKRSIKNVREEFVDPNHFGLSMRVSLKGENSLEVWLERASDGKITSLRIKDDQMTFGYRKSGSDEFTAKGTPTEIARLPDDENIGLHIERDEHDWLVSQVIDGESLPRLLLWAPIKADTPDEIRFKAKGDSVYVGEIELLELVRKREE